MKIDVSDLFDDLYGVALLARAKFKNTLLSTLDPYEYRWQAFCDALSEKLFLPACASLALDLTHNHFSNEQLKSRIITELLSECGKQRSYCRYRGPYFDEDPGFTANPWDEEKDGGAIFRRPQAKLVLWLGKLPPSEVKLTPPIYPEYLDAPIRYFSRQYFGFLSRLPVIRYYEFHGEWCLRRMEQHGAQLTRETLGGQWLRPHGKLDEIIHKERFEEVWEAAIDRTR